MKNGESQKRTLLVVDDEPLVLELLSSGLKRDGFRVLRAGDGHDAMQVFQAETIDLALIDYSLPDICGSELFKQFHALNPLIPVIVLTGHPNLETAVDLMKAGIRDYMSKPFSLKEVSARIRAVLDAMAEDSQPESVEAGRAVEAAPTANEYVFGNSEAVRIVEAQVRDLARYPSTTVLISGPTGTGKTAVARRVHELTCGESAPFVEIDCSTIPHELCESELFGHEKGSFTGAHCTKSGLFEAAGRGTAFLDEIGELEPRLQAKFLRVLEARQFKRVGGHSVFPMQARIIAATNRSLLELVQAGQFREDLYFRLNVIELWMPPLRDRGDDILTLSRHFLNLFTRKHNKQISGFTAEALAFIRESDFPGNIRELRNLVERAVIQAATSQIDLPHLIRNRPVTTRTMAVTVPPPMATATAVPPPKPADVKAPGDGSTLAQLERTLLFDALNASHGNKSKAAQLVGLSRTAFYRRLQKHSAPGPGPANGSSAFSVDPNPALVLPPGHLTAWPNVMR